MSECLQDTDADELCPDNTMIWGSYKTNDAWEEQMGEWFTVVTEGGVCLYCSRVYMNKYTGRKDATLKADMISDKELSDEFMKYRLWVIMETC